MFRYCNKIKFLIKKKILESVKYFRCIKYFKIMIYNIQKKKKNLIEKEMLELGYFFKIIL